MNENCLFCLGHSKALRKLPNYEYVGVFLQYYDNDWYPNKACSSCRAYYSEFLNGLGNEKLLKQIVDKPHLNQKIEVPRRKSGLCFCVICKYIQGRIRVKGQTVNTKKDSSHKRKRKSIHETETRCAFCLTLTRKLHLHRCNKYVLFENIKNICVEKNAVDDIISSLLRFKTKYGNQNRLITLYKGEKTQAQILYKPNQRQMTQRDVVELQRAINGSGRKRQRALAIIKRSLGRAAVVSNIDNKLASEVEKYKYLYSSKVLTFNYEPEYILTQKLLNFHFF